MNVLFIVVVALAALIWGVITLKREIRRSQWEKKNTTPLFNITESRELAATLAFAHLKIGGELTAEQKDTLLEHYASELKYEGKSAAEMYSYATYLIGTDANFASKVAEIVNPALDQFSQAQRASTLELMRRLVPQPTAAQSEFLAQVEEALA